MKLNKSFITREFLIRILSMLFPFLILSCTENRETGVDSKRAELISAFEQSEKFTRIIVEQMPDSLFGFRASPDVMTFAEQWRHCVIYTCGQLSSRLGIDNPYKDRKLPLDMSKKAVQDELAQMYVFIGSVVRELPAEKLEMEVQLGESRIPGWRLFYAMENHIIHHRGQCIIYLRLNGIKPVGYYGW